MRINSGKQLSNFNRKIKNHSSVFIDVTEKVTPKIPAAKRRCTLYMKSIKIYVFMNKNHHIWYWLLVLVQNIKTIYRTVSGRWALQLDIPNFRGQNITIKLERRRRSNPQLYISILKAAANGRFRVGDFLRLTLAWPFNITFEHWRLRIEAEKV